MTFTRCPGCRSEDIDARGCHQCGMRRHGDKWTWRIEYYYAARRRLRKNTDG